jgi:hypothetical protein
MAIRMVNYLSESTTKHTKHTKKRQRQKETAYW